MNLTFSEVAWLIVVYFFVKGFVKVLGEMVAGIIIALITGKNIEERKRNLELLYEKDRKQRWEKKYGEKADETEAVKRIGFN